MFINNLDVTIFRYTCKIIFTELTDDESFEK